MVSADVLALSERNAEWDEKIKSVGGFPASPGTIEGLRTQIAARKKALTETQGGGQKFDIKEEDHTITARDGYEIPVRIYRPAKPPANGCPVIVMLHGGGFCIGDVNNEELNCRLFASRFDVVAVNVVYRLAPEHPFPASINDSWDAVKWVAANATSLGADLERGFLVGGTSAGGNMTDVIGHLARDEDLSPPLTGLLELIPALCAPAVVPEKYKDEFASREQNADAEILSRSMMDFFMEHYKPDVHSTLFSPFLDPKNHRDIPPVCFQVCGADPLRDDAIVYERILREQGTPTKLFTYRGLPHGYWSIFPDLECSRKFVAETMEGLQWLLSFSVEK